MYLVGLGSKKGRQTGKFCEAGDNMVFSASSTTYDTRDTIDFLKLYCLIFSALRVPVERSRVVKEKTHYIGSGELFCT